MEKNKKISEPTMAFIELTNICNAKCPGCIANNGKEKEQLGIKQWEKILSNLHPSTNSIRITGGEPTQYKYFTEFLEILEKRSLNYTIFTNGLWKSPPKIIKLLKRAKHFYGLSFSLHGCNPASHQQFTGIESFDETTKNIRLSAKSGFRVQTNTILGEHNKREIKEFVKFAYGLGVQLLVFSRYLGPIRNGISIFKEELSLIIQFLENIKKTGVPISIGHCLPFCYAYLPVSCLAGQSFSHIDYQGNLHPCSFSPNIWGNVLKEPAEKIFKTQKVTAWIKDFPQACKGCTVIDACKGGCKAIREILGIRKDPLMWEPIRKKLKTPLLRKTI